MSTVTTFTCDRCSETAVDDRKFLAEVRVEVVRYYGPALHQHAMWCRKCLIALGIYQPETKKGEEPAPAPAPLTLEDLIREIVRQELP